jgi:heptosyltransferase-1
LGDVVHNLPIIADIKMQFPDAEIDWVVEENFAEIPAMHPGVNRVIKVAVRRWRKALFSKPTWHEIFAFKRQLQLQQYDIVIDAQGLLKSALITLLSRSANKCGYDKTSAREPIARFFYDHHYIVSRTLQAVSRNRLLAASALGYQVNEAVLSYGIKLAPAEAENYANNLPKQYIMALHGTSRDSKLWAEQHWVVLGRQLQLQEIAMVLPWGNDAEKQRAERIASQLEQSIVLPKLGLKSLAAIIDKAQAIIGVDTGLAHLAVALNKPVIGIYTDTNPERTGLVGNSQQVCINLTQPSPQEIVAQLKTLNIIQ